MSAHEDRPSLEELGRDLLTVPRWRLALTLTTPFLLTAFATLLLVLPWHEWQINLLPLVAFGWLLVAYHSWVLVRLLWQRLGR